MSKIIDEIEAARNALAKGDVTDAFDRLSAAGRETFQKDVCPGCGTLTDILVKSGHLAAECKKCGATWGKRSSGPIGPLVKSVRKHSEVKDMSYSKGRPEVEAKLWELWRTSGGQAIDAYDINQYSATGVIKKSLLEAIGIEATTKVPVEEPMIKTGLVAEPTWGGLNKSEVLNLMFEMFKTGEAHQYVNRHSMTKFDQFGILDPEAARVILQKAGKDPDALSKSPTPKLEDQEGIDPEVADPGLEPREEPKARFGRQQQPIKPKDIGSIGEAKLKQLVFDNPANGEAEGLKSVGKGKGESVAKTGPNWSDKDERQYQHIKESSLKAGKSKKVAQRIAAATVNAQKSESASLDLKKAHEAEPNVHASANLSTDEKLNLILRELEQIEAAVGVHESVSDERAEEASVRKSAVDVSAPAPAPTSKLGHHFIFSAENPAHPDKVTIKAGHDQVLHGLRRMGMSAREVKGKYGGQVERSIMVCEPKEHDIHTLHQLAAGLGQESALHSDGNTHRLYYYHGPNAGKYHEGRGTEWMSQEPEDAYTEMADPDTGARSYFRHNLDFSQLHDHVNDGSKAAGEVKEAPVELPVHEDVHAEERHAPEPVQKSESKPPKKQVKKSESTAGTELLAKAMKSLAPAPSAPAKKPGTLMKKPVGPAKSPVVGGAGTANYVGAPEMTKGIAGPKPGTATAPKPASSAKAITTPVGPKAGGMTKAVKPIGLKPAGSVAPAAPTNVDIERKQSAEPEAQVHSLTAPKPPEIAKPKFDPASIGIGASGKKMIKPIKKSEALDQIQAKIERLGKSADPLARAQLRGLAEKYTKVSLMKGDEVLLDEGE